MTHINREIGFDGVQDHFPAELKGAIQHLVARLDRSQASIIDQLRRSTMTFTNSPTADAPEGMAANDIWINSAGLRQYDGSDWQWVYKVP